MPSWLGRQLFGDPEDVIAAIREALREIIPPGMSLRMLPVDQAAMDALMGEEPDDLSEDDLMTSILYSTPTNGRPN